MSFAIDILVADDDPGVRRYLRRKLSFGGYEATVIETAEAALARIGQKPPDAIILGTALSDATIEATIKAVRAICSAPMLALLDGGQETAIPAVLDSGADQVFSKTTLD